jgi:ligand-binding SRPBCC domain-containing protein
VDGTIRVFRENGETVLESEQWIPRPVDEVFRFFSVETNLERITPPFLGFRVLRKSTPELGEGTLIDYRLSLRGIPMRWRTRIEEWRPGERFVDIQLSGPYALWHHTHVFEAKDGGTLMRDRVRFRLPLGRLGELVAGWMVRRDVRGIFGYRTKVIGELFPVNGTSGNPG